MIAAVPNHAGTTLVAGQGIRGVQSYQQMVRKMLVPTAKGTVVLKARPNFAAGTEWTQPTPGQPVTIDLGPENGEQEFEHELGHVFDLTTMNDTARRRFQALVGMRNVGWWGGPVGQRASDAPGDPGDTAPGEHFAEIYRILAQHRDKLASRKTWDAYRRVASFQYLSSVPSFFQARKVAALIDQMGGS